MFNRWRPESNRSCLLQRCIQSVKHLLSSNRKRQAVSICCLFTDKKFLLQCRDIEKFKYGNGLFWGSKSEPDTEIMEISHLGMNNT